MTLPMKYDSIGDFYALDESGLEITRTLTDDEWVNIGRALSGRLGHIRWAIGDWLIYGDVLGQHGRTFQRAMEITGLSESSLSRYYAVCAAYPRRLRVKGATWGLYNEAMLLRADLRVPFIQKVVDKGWTHKIWRHELTLLPQENRQRRPRSVVARTREAPIPGAYEPNWTLPPTEESSVDDDSATLSQAGVECPHCHGFIPEVEMQRYRTIK